MDTNSSALGKLLPKSITAKRRRRKQQQSDASSDELGPRGRSPAPSRETLDSDSTSSSLPMGAEDEGSSLGSAEGVDADPQSTRPTAISAHPSQIGYLTTSSPLVQAEHLQGSQSPNDARPDASPRSSTFPSKFSDSLEFTPSLHQSTTGLASPWVKEQTRSPSPVGRFREVFRSKTASTGTASPSPERRPVTPAVVAIPASIAVATHPKTEACTRTESITAPAEPSVGPAKDSDAAKGASAERFRRLSKGQRIDTASPPRTPPNAEKATPVIVNTPPTPTDRHNPGNPTSPTNQSTRPKNPSTDSPGTASAAKPKESTPSPSAGNMIQERRLRSGSGTLGPSKLSNITLAPLSPTPESGPITPSAAGFFSSMLSAAQNAASSLSNTISTTNLPNLQGGTTRSRGSSLRDDGGSTGDRVEVESFPGANGQGMDSKEPAVRTLGQGDLSLSQLGIVEPSASNAATPVASRFPDSGDSRARSESAPVESQSSGMVSELHSEDSQGISQARTLYEPAGSVEQTTPSGSIYDDKTGITRTGSIRSAIGRHRKRGSSAATGGTGGTIAAAINAANASVAHPAAQNSTTKLTGFAVASKKRNRDFHTLFKSVPDDDYLIEDYSCALQREILAHGRLYVSEGHLCFSSNILGWVTTLVMSFDEIVSVEKRSTALVFKNGLMISTLHAKHIFASFTSRDSTYDLIIKIWKLGHPSLQSSLNGVRLEETGGDKTEKVDEVGSNASQSGGSASEDETDEEDDVYDEDEEDEDDAPDSTQLTDPAAMEVETEKAVSRKPSGAVAANGSSTEKPKDAPTGAAGSAGGGSAGDDFPGPATHGPTECGDADTHYDKLLGDDLIPAPLGKVFSMMFGATSVTWMSKWLATDQKCFDLQMEDQKGLGPDNRSRNYTYIKPLNASIGPRQTKCIVNEHVDNIDYEKAVNITCTTQNPDVPSGNVFNVKTRYCLSWGENNSTRVQVNCTTEWTGKSWLKGPIEKGVNDGQTQYIKDLFASLKLAVSSRSRAGTAINGGPGATGKGGKKKGRKGKAAPASSPTSDVEGSMTKGGPAAKKQDWGLLEPVHGLVGPLVDILQPLMTGNVVYGLFVGLLVASWFGFGFVNKPAGGRGYAGQELGYLGYVGYPDRLAAYEEIWRREESELWEWLEERVGLERLNEGVGGSKNAAGSPSSPPPGPPPPRKKAVEPRMVEEKLREGRADEREIREAIKVTEEKLKALKGVIERRNQLQEQPR